ncbi:MAG: peptidylprolyl isomerase [Candidatus Hatepunaea meridiana]|nr:peptidylprolyl isomerase [Candidatus Hatepunaea meridiana]
MTQLRTQVKWVFAILAVLFLGTIVFDWGMGGFKSRDKPGVIGEIDDYDFTMENFQKIIRFEQQKSARQSDEELDDKQLKQLREDAWNNEVERVLKWKDAKRLGIEVTDRQIAHIVENHPPNEIRQVESFQSDGEFDIQLYKDYLREPSALQYLYDIEQRVRDFLYEQELNFHVTQCIDVSTGDVKDEYLSQTAVGKLRFIAILKDGFEIDSTEINEKMMRHYYQLFSSKFKKYPQRKFAYVKFTITPTDQDKQDILQDINGIMEDIESGADFATLAEKISEDKATKVNGGDLGWFDFDGMMKPFSEAAFAANIGMLVGPVETKQGYHIILIEDKRTEGGVEEIKARHILLKIKASPDTRDQVYADAYNFAQDAKERDFAEVAEEYNYSIDTTAAFSEAGYIQGLSRMRMAAQFCFNNPIGTVSDVVYPYPDGNVVFQISEVIEESIKPYDEVKGSIHKSISKILLKHKIWDKAAELSAKIEKPEDLDRVAAEYKYTVHTTEDSLKPSGKLPNGLKRDKDFLKEAFRLNEGEISEVIQTNKGCYIAYMESKLPFNEEDYLSFHSTIYQSLISKKHDQAVKNWIRELRVAADINDYRYKYFRDF